MKSSPKLGVVALGVALLALVVSTARAEQPWPLSRHDAQATGKSSYAGPIRPGKAWWFQTFAQYAPPVIDAQGTILDARIVPPTSQNQRRIEEDLRDSVERFADLPDEELQVRCEQTIRNYDPCISCSTHFLKLAVRRP